MKLLPTADGSLTIQLEGKDTTYHSRHGAIGESMHVYIQSGLQYVLDTASRTEISIFEMGFGTGLNTLLTFIETTHRGTIVSYDAIDVQPIPGSIISELNYTDLLERRDLDSLFRNLHATSWNEPVHLSPQFRFRKRLSDVHLILPDDKYDLIYYDAFSPRDVPEQWTVPVFEKMHSMLNEKGVLVTYCSKSIVRRAMQAAGFEVHKLPGPYGKREIVRAIKT